VVNDEDRDAVSVGDGFQARHCRVVGLVAVHVAVDDAAHLREHIHDDEATVGVLSQPCVEPVAPALEKLLPIGLEEQTIWRGLAIETQAEATLQPAGGSSRAR
jgi:hypothetical protein